MRLISYQIIRFLPFSVFAIVKTLIVIILNILITQKKIDGMN